MHLAKVTAMWFRSTVALWKVAAVVAFTASTVVAAEVLRRDFALIQDALGNLNSLLQQLDTSILALNESNIRTAGPALLNLADIIRPSLIGSASQIQSSDPLTLEETQNLNAARTALNANVNLTVSDLIRQKPLFDSAGLSQEVAGELQIVRDMSGQFFGTIQSKLDPGVPSIVTQLNATLGLFDSVIATFRGSSTDATDTSNPTNITTNASGTGVIDGNGACVCMATCSAGLLGRSIETNNYNEF